MQYKKRAKTTISKIKTLRWPHAPNLIFLREIQTRYYFHTMVVFGKKKKKNTFKSRIPKISKAVVNLEPSLWDMGAPMCLLSG